jgi:hypothetical protein
VFAARKKSREHTQIGVGEQQSLGLASDGSCGSHNRPQMFAAGQGMKMFRADPGEMGNFVFGESLLSGLYGDHFPAVLYDSCKRLEHLKTDPKSIADYFPSNQSAVC